MELRKKTDSNPEFQVEEDVILSHPEETQDQSEVSAELPKKRSQFGCLFWLIVFFILSVLGAMALPNFLTCGNKAKQSEAKQYVGSMNRAQQAYFLEKNKFSHQISALELGIKTQTENYQYSIRSTPSAAFSYGIARKAKKNLKSYVGGVFLVPATYLDSSADKNEQTLVSIVCEGKPFSQTPSAEPSLHNGVPTCGDNTTELK